MYHFPKEKESTVYGSPFSHHGFLFVSNILFGFGKNDHGQLGTGDSKHNLKLTKIPFEKNIKRISCGGLHTFFQDYNGFVYSCGDNSYYQLCLGDKNKFDRYLPTIVSFDDIEVEEIFLGDSHSVFLTKSMEVYSGGCNYDAQLGVGDIKVRSKPTKVILTEKIISVTCGGDNTFFISINGSIFATGSNIHGELGVKENDLMFPQPVKISFFKDKKIMQIACGFYCSFFLCSDNKVYATGYNTYGQLGICNESMNTTSEQPSILLLSSLEKEKIISIKCGGWHTLFLSEKKMFLTGCNEEGQLGNGNFQNVFSPFLFSIEKKKIIYSLLLNGSSIYFTNDEVWGCGMNTWGQLFNLDQEYEERKINNPKIMKLCDLKVKKNPTQVKSKMKLNEIKERFEYFAFKIPITTVFL